MANGICGKSFLLKDDSGNTFAMARTTTLSMNNQTVDATAKDTNGWQEFISDCGIKSMTMSLAGIYTNQSYEVTMLQDFMSGVSKEFTIIDGYGNTMVGFFIISDYEQSGEFNDAQLFTATLQSSGVPIYTPAP